MEKSSLDEQAKITTLCELASYRLEELLDELGVKLRRSGKMFVGACPIHGGNNVSAFNLYPDGHTVRGNWVCRTHGCHKIFKTSLLGLVRGVLSHDLNNWQSSKDTPYSFPKAVRWLCDFVGQKWSEVKADIVAAEKNKFLSQMAVLNKTVPQAPEAGWTRELLRSRLRLPSTYYLSRGYQSDTLDRYDVGDSKVTDPIHPMFNRTVVPVYDTNGGRVIGVTGRSLWPVCGICGRWHDPTHDCPSGANARLPSFAKWRNSNNFARERHLYNFWFAREHIRNCGQVLLVESPGDVWRVFEGGFNQSLGLFGTDLTDPQQIVLEGSGAMEVIIATNNDTAGRKAAVAMINQLNRTFRVRKILTPTNDIGDMSLKEVTVWLEKHGLKKT